MHKQFEHPQEAGRLKRGKTTILDHTDGCSGQCRSALTLCLMTVMTVSCGVVIDRMVNVLADGKGLVDALNAITKRFLRECMRRLCSVQKSEETEEMSRKFQAWMHENSDEKSFAEQAKRLCMHNERKDGVKSAGKKHQKCEANRKNTEG